MVELIAPAIDRHDGSAWRTAAVRARELRPAVSVESEVPHEAAFRVMLDCADENVVYIPLDVRPPVGAICA